MLGFDGESDEQSLYTLIVVFFLVRPVVLESLYGNIASSKAKSQIGGGSSLSIRWQRRAVAVSQRRGETSGSFH